MISGIIHIIVHLGGIIQCAVEFEGRRGLSDAGRRKTDGKSKKTDRGLGKMGKYRCYRIFSFHELDIERFLITYLDEMQVIGNPSTNVPRHAAVVEAGPINKKMVLRVTVQFYAAVTAHARIHMYPFIRTESCYYTDTDSAMTKRPPLPESQGSPALGK